MSTAIFFIAIVPGAEICSEVKDFQLIASQNFQSARALRAPPHITLIPPFKWELDGLKHLEDVLRKFTATQKPLLIRLRDFGAFPPRVVFVDIEESDALCELRGALKSCLDARFDFKSERPDRPFRPHMTVAFRDLRKSKFHMAWRYFSSLEYQREFVANQLFLLQHDGARWKNRESFQFSRC